MPLSCGITLTDGTGLNYYLRGHNAKVSVDYSFVDQDNLIREDQPVVTVQVAVGF